jgi:hypothetical protein
VNAAAKVTPIRPSAVAPTAEYLSPEQVCELVPGLTVANLKDLRSSGKGPAFCKPTGERGHVTVYRRTDVVAWVEQSRTTTREQS